MTYTGYSCAYMRRKSKHGCPDAVEHYCTENGKIIDPMSCHKRCKRFERLVSWRKLNKKMGVELL